MKLAASPQAKIYPKIGQVQYHPRNQKNIRLSIRSNHIRVSYPTFMNFKKVEDFVLTKRSWILKHKRPELNWSSNMNIGRKHQLRITDEINPHISSDGIIYSPNDVLVIEKLVKQALKIEAKAELQPIVEDAIEKTGLKPTHIRYRYMKTQWGSCNSTKIISLNNALIYLPRALVEYVIIHELCHLEMMNHSNQFWQLVESFLVDYKRSRKQLKSIQINLVIDYSNNFIYT